MKGEKMTNWVKKDGAYAKWAKRSVKMSDGAVGKWAKRDGPMTSWAKRK